MMFNLYYIFRSIYVRKSHYFFVLNLAPIRIEGRSWISVIGSLSSAGLQQKWSAFLDLKGWPIFILLKQDYIHYAKFESKIFLKKIFIFLLISAHSIFRVAHAIIAMSLSSPRLLWSEYGSCDLSGSIHFSVFLL